MNLCYGNLCNVREDREHKGLQRGMQQFHHVLSWNISAPLLEQDIISH